ncbi:MAG: type I DNA topoisomerase [Bacteroidales bacterium]|nr:type I DNA topoisomerase [Bacteroidales bacterium]
MSKNLVIVESPSKAKTIERFLGKEYTVRSSMGHIRDLPEKKIGIDIAHQFTPQYEVLPNKQKIISELKKLGKEADVIWLATDEDREGEAISWHLMDELKYPAEKTRRIAFHEITPKAIAEAIANPRDLDINLVNAQQARRVLDRIVGFELSPVLWRKVRPSLSAGRVQSVAVRLVVEREKEINRFEPARYYKVVGTFRTAPDAPAFEAELNTRFETEEAALDFLERCKNAQFTAEAIETQPVKRSPAPPFTTATLQQEAARKLGMSVSRTMSIAQQLYEAGHITYMRTDSVNLSDLALATSRETIIGTYGEKYAKTRKYTTKTKGAQEAHEAIRPTYMSKSSIGGADNQSERLYQLIWKRTLASQMADAKLEKTTVTIVSPDLKEYFVSVGEVLLFDGFLKVYKESREDAPEEESRELPALKQGMALFNEQVQATEKHTLPPYRYTEASLVHKLEELGIGRPSTYAPIISTIQKRNYVVKGNKEGGEREYRVLSCKKGKITTATKKEKVGYEKGKLLPTDIGNVVNSFLTVHFEQIMDYHFTADVEQDFDKIAQGKLEWRKMMTAFYKNFHQSIETTLETSEKASGERLLGVDPATGYNVYAKLARYGAVVQRGRSNSEDQLSFAKLLPHQSIDTITFEEAMALFQLPRTVGTCEGQPVVVNIGRYGPYIQHNSKFYALPKSEDLWSISMERCLEIMEAKKKADKSKEASVIGEWNGLPLSVAVGRFGPYILYDKHFYALPKNTDIHTVSVEQAKEVIRKYEEKNVLRRFEEDTDLRVLKGRFGPYIAYKGSNYKLPKDSDISQLTYTQCTDIVKEGNASGKGSGARKRKASTRKSKA